MAEIFMVLGGTKSFRTMRQFGRNVRRMLTCASGMHEFVTTSWLRVCTSCMRSMRDCSSMPTQEEMSSASSCWQQLFSCRMLSSETPLHPLIDRDLRHGH